MLPATTISEIEAMLALARSGDIRALDALIARCLPYMKKYLAPSFEGMKADRASGNNADVIMDAAARVARKFTSFKGTTAPSFLRWLKRIVIRGKIDADRRANRQKRRPAVAGRDLPSELISGEEMSSRSQKPSERLDAIETWLALLTAVIALPPKQREPFWLCCICERAQDEVATKLGRSRASIAGDISRAREVVQGMLRSADHPESQLIDSGAGRRKHDLLPMETVVIAGRFELGPLIAMGTVSRVHRGVDRQTRQEVAISILNYEHCSSAELVARFVNESSWLRSLSAPHVATVLSGGMLRGGQPFLVQEWLPVSLADVLKQGPLSSAIAQATVAQIVHGISTLHSSGLIHRDIAPSRFRISRWDQCAIMKRLPLIKLTNIRLAKPLLSRKIETPLPISTHGATLAGSAEYRAPELWLDTKQAGAGADVYSIGAVWYALLVGAPPFAQAAGESVQSLMQRCLHLEPPLERLPEPNPLLVQMLSKIPSARPTLLEVSNSLQSG